MLRTLLGYAALAVIGLVLLKVVFALLGVAVSLFVSLVWFAAIGFVIYLVLKVISPASARRVREAIGGRRRAA